MVTMKAFGVVLLVTVVSSYIIMDGDDCPEEEVYWPTEYYFRGEKIDLTVSIKETFEIWYSAELNRSRISYYDRLDSTYYYGDMDSTVFTYNVYYKTSETLETSVTCSKDRSEGEIEDFLPSIENLTYYGEMKYNDKTLRVWKSVITEEESTMENILHVYRDEEDSVDIPVRYESKTYNAWTQALTAHSITEYYDFQYPDDAELEVDESGCEYQEVGNDLQKALKFYHPDIGSGLDKAFHAYKHHHNRQYDGTEHEMRKRIFQKNWRQVMTHNKKNLSYKMAVNRFSDRTAEELRHLTATLPNPLGRGSMEFPHSAEEVQALANDLPPSYDMKLEGFISRVKNQGNCGSCWSFSTTAAVEGALSRSNGGRNIKLSEQSLVDCAWGFDNYGCSGGMLDRAMKYVVEYGIPTEREYGSYLEQNGYCKDQNMTTSYKIAGFARVPPLGVEGMKVALYKYGPVAVAIYASDNLSKYSSGVFFDPECENQKYINHGVTVVGYGVRDNTLYWIVKNSWGEDWGQDGYVLMSATNDNCLLLTEAYYPII